MAIRKEKKTYLVFIQEQIIFTQQATKKYSQFLNTRYILCKLTVSKSDANTFQSSGNGWILDQQLIFLNFRDGILHGRRGKIAPIFVEQDNSFANELFMKKNSNSFKKSSPNKQRKDIDEIVRTLFKPLSKSTSIHDTPDTPDIPVTPETTTTSIRYSLTICLVD